MVGKYVPPMRRLSLSVSMPEPLPRNGVAVRPMSMIPHSDISDFLLSQLKPISRSTLE